MLSVKIEDKVTTVYLLKIRQDKNNYCRVLPKQIEIKLQISHRNAKMPNNSTGKRYTSVQLAVN